MAPELLNSTMAAGLKPFLRESVNAVRGRVMVAAKVGNATPKELRPARNSGRGESEQGGRAVTDGSHSHIATGL